MAPGRHLRTLLAPIIRGARRTILAPALSRLSPIRQVSVDGRTMRVDLRDQIIGRSLFIWGGFGTRVSRFLKCLDLEGGVVVDLGAHIGVYTILLSDLVGPGGQVLALEPEAHNYALLEWNLRANGVTNVSARRCAAGERSGRMVLVINGGNHGDHYLATSHVTGARAQTVDVAPLDELLGDVPDGRVRLVKIDVQGAESLVLRGMRETLARNPELVLLMEVDPTALARAGSSPSELVALARELGLDGWDIGQDRISRLLEPWEYDLLYEGEYADVALSRSDAHLRRAVERMTGRSIGPVV